jgi:hypothetical protein
VSTRRKKSERAARPVDRYELWVAFARGVLSTVRHNTMPPLHPELNRWYYDGVSMVASGHVVVGDAEELARMIEHVWAGNKPHTFKP